MNNTSRALAFAAALAAASAHATCWNEAARRYGIPADLLRAVAQVESNFDATAENRNRNGSGDTGLMQINSTWQPTLAHYGIHEADLYQPCTNLLVGAWILAGNIARLGWNWDAIGAYNAGCKNLSQSRCDALRNRYAWRVWRAWRTPATTKTSAR